MTAAPPSDPPQPDPLADQAQTEAKHRERRTAEVSVSTAAIEALRNRPVLLAEPPPAAPPDQGEFPSLQPGPDQASVTETLPEAEGGEVPPAAAPPPAPAVPVWTPVRRPARERSVVNVGVPSAALDALRRGVQSARALLSGEPAPRFPAPRAPIDGPVRIAEIDADRSRTMLYESVEGLRGRLPLLAADRTLSQRQARGFVAFGVVLLLGLLIVTKLSLVAVIAMATAVYTLVMSYRLLLFKRTLRDTTLIHVTDDEARSIAEDDLPTYTVLVPAYREPEVINQLLNYIDGFDYPRDKLDVKLLLEADDELTLQAVRRATTGSHVEVVLVPPADPRTKPKACNYGLQIARGDYVTIYDAEDRPEPLQLRRAVFAFRDLGPEVACLQARLGYYNGPQNIITKWFDLEYIAWFRHLLPGLVSLGAPVPLGGTSNHIRRSALLAVGAWDAFNVTEDADLGIRLHRVGYEVAVLDSITLEEANSDFVNWAKQRSRWYKGYLQTWLVHMRHPRTLSRDLGVRGFIGFNLFVGGTPVLALLNPFFWTLSLLYFLTSSAYIETLFPAPVYYPALVCFVIGNSAVVYMNLLTARIAQRPDLIVCALLSPVYWVMMSIAAIKAALQLIQDPSFWEKTTHGLSVEGPVAHVPG